MTFALAFVLAYAMFCFVSDYSFSWRSAFLAFALGAGVDTVVIAKTLANIAAANVKRKR